MSDEGKIGKEIINYSVNRGEQICSSKNERELRNLGIESSPNSSNKSVGEWKFNISSRLFATAVVKNLLLS